MGVTKIEWTSAADGTPGYSFNPWVGCTKVSAACDHCYAESWAKRGGHPELWEGDRRRTREENWRQPIKWSAAAKAAGMRRRVFCASLADVWDNQVPMAWRTDLFNLIWATKHLDWLLLTKRPQNITKMLPSAIGKLELWPWPNVWLGTTAENQEEWDRRLPHLGAVPARVHFVSVEPMLGEIDCGNAFDDPPEGSPYQPVNWVICGGESGGGARMMRPEWARSLRNQCQFAGVPFFLKQMTKKAAIPDDLMVREFPP